MLINRRRTEEISSEYLFVLMLSKTIVVFIVIIGSDLIPMGAAIHYLFIDTDLRKTLNDICATNQRNKLFTKSLDESLIGNYFKQNNCFNEMFVLNKVFAEESNELKNVFKQKDFNLFLELNDENQLKLVNNKLFGQLFSMYVNIIVILFKCDSGLKSIAQNMFNRFNDLRSYVICYDKNDLKSVKTAYIRPVINGCHSVDKILYSTDIETNHSIRSKTCNLNGSLLTVSVNRDLPYCDIEFINNSYVMKDSVEAKMLNVLKQKFNFVYELNYANQSWGTQQNGQWSGSVGHLINRV